MKKTDSRGEDGDFHKKAEVITSVDQALPQLMALNPDVLAIKQTLYRTGADSPIVDHLVTAARSGKEVTVVIAISVTPVPVIMLV